MLMIVPALIASAITPTVARAADPRVNCLQAFASIVPASKCDPSTFRHLPPATPDVITPLTRLYNYGSNVNDYLGVVKVEGNATPGSRVTITISDGVKSINRTATAAPSPDSNYGQRAGDFEVLFDPTRDFSQGPLSVQELGSHSAGPDAFPTMPNPTPTDLGQTVLTVSAVALVGSISSAPLAVEIFKRPATPGDEFGPELGSLRFPPQHWCHYSGRGAQAGPSSQGQESLHLGGQADGTCSSFAVTGLGAVPDVTWTLCTRYTGRLPDEVPDGVIDAQRALIDAHRGACDLAAGCAGADCSLYGCVPACDRGNPSCDPHSQAELYNTTRNLYCRVPENQSMPTQHAPLSGRADDLAGGPDGFASEIRSVVITITQGEEIVRTFTDAFARTNSTSAAWGWELNINDFAPTYPGGTPYVITVTATDAWGNATEESSQPITVYPY